MSTKQKITGIIEGLPSSFNTEYIIKTEKNCTICQEKITIEEINEKQIVYVENIEYCHKSCLKEKGIEYEHIREKDNNSPAKMIMLQKIKPKSRKEKVKEKLFIDDYLQAFVYEMKRKNEMFIIRDFITDDLNLAFSIRLKDVKCTKYQTKYSKPLFEKEYIFKPCEIECSNKLDLITELLIKFMDERKKQQSECANHSGQ
jgi:hypothetical protein